MEIVIPIPEDQVPAIIIAIISAGWTLFQELRHRKNRGSTMSWKKKKTVEDPQP